MPAKRQRIENRSTFEGADMFDGVSLPTESAASKFSYPSDAARSWNNQVEFPQHLVTAIANRPFPRFLTLSSPLEESVDAADRERIGGFLGKCYYCKKSIRKNSDVFMYRDMCAFCTAECRAMQISLDKEEENSKQMVSHFRGRDNVKDRLVFLLE